MGAQSRERSWGKTLKNIHTAPHERRPIHVAILDLIPSWR